MQGIHLFMFLSLVLSVCSIPDINARTTQTEPEAEDRISERVIEDSIWIEPAVGLINLGCGFYITPRLEDDVAKLHDGDGFWFPMYAGLDFRLNGKWHISPGLNVLVYKFSYEKESQGMGFFGGLWTVTRTGLSHVVAPEIAISRFNKILPRLNGYLSVAALKPFVQSRGDAVRLLENGPGFRIAYGFYYTFKNTPYVLIWEWRYQSIPLKATFTDIDTDSETVTCNTISEGVSVLVKFGIDPFYWWQNKQ